MGYVWRAKSNPRPQEFYRAGTAPPGFEIPGSATVTLAKLYGMGSLKNYIVL